MKKSIDARGLQCPLPVIETKKLLKAMTEGEVTVLVDNEIAVQNLTKMAKQMKLICSSEVLEQNTYSVRIEVPFSEQGSLSEEDVAEKLTGKKEQSNSDKDIKPEEDELPTTVIVLSKDHMGEGDENLGKTLIKGFIYALTELEKMPDKIILYNGGAKLSVEGSDSLADLKLLESQGVEILTCGACLNFYELTDKLAVGSITNMYVIAEILMDAGHIIQP